MPIKTKLGDFAAGELPPPLLVNFEDLDGDPVDLGGFTPFVKIEAIPDPGVSLGQGTVTVTNAAQGEVTYTWAEDDMQIPATYQMLVWVDDGGTARFASDLLEYTVYDGPGSTPKF